MFKRLVLAAVIFAHSPASAQDATTRAQAADLFDQGRADVSAGNYASACPKFEESLRLDAQIGTKLNLANCYEQLGRIASAWALYTEVAETAKHDQDRTFADSAATRLKPRLPRIEIAQPTVAGTTIILDGAPVTAGMPRVVDPGPHTVQFEAPGHIAQKREVIAVEGTVVPVAVPDLAPVVVPREPPVAVTPPPPETPSVMPTEPVVSVDAPPSRSPMRWLAIGAAGAGIIGLGVGTWAGLDARSKRDDARAAGCNDDLSMCPDAALSIADSAHSRGNLATGMFVGGSLLVGAAVVMWVLSPSSSSAATTTSWRVTPSIHPQQIGFTVGHAL